MNTKRRAHCQLWHDWKERIIRIGDEQTSLQNQFDNLRNEFTDNSPRIEALETDVNALDGRLIIAETDIAEVEDRVTACENDIDRIDAELVDKTGEINNLANRMTLAEADIDDLDARLEGIEAGEILLSQLVPDADKDMGGKTLNNVKINANEVSVRGSRIEPSRINNHILLFDYQEFIDNEDLTGLKQSTPGDIKFRHNNDNSLPFTKYIEVTRKTDIYGEEFPLIPVVPGERITGEVWFKKNGYNEHTAGVAFGVHFHDSNGIRIPWPQSKTDFIGSSVGGYQSDEWILLRASTTVPLSHTPTNGSDGKGLRFITPHIVILKYQDTPTEGYSHCMAGFRLYRDANFNTNLSAKIISADGVVIKDGGTVDGVDISTHTHDGTAIGGPKISYNNLLDKPTIPTKLSQLATDENNQLVSAAEKAEWNRISTHTHDGTTAGGPKISYNDLVDKPDIPTSFPKPPMPYKKTVSINLELAGDYIDVLDIIPEGRTALTVEQLQYREIANIDAEKESFVVIYLRYDDNTVATGIDRISKNGDTDWHYPTYIQFNPVYHFTKNYIIGIRIQRTPRVGPNITGYVDIIGHVY